MQWLIEDGIQLLGIGILKTVTFGRYRTAGSSGLLLEGGTGLLLILGVTWVVYSWWPV